WYFDSGTGSNVSNNIDLTVAPEDGNMVQVEGCFEIADCPTNPLAEIGETGVPGVPHACPQAVPGARLRARWGVRHVRRGPRGPVPGNGRAEPGVRGHRCHRRPDHLVVARLQLGARLARLPGVHRLRGAGHPVVRGVVRSP